MVDVEVDVHDDVHVCETCEPDLPVGMPRSAYPPRTVYTFDNWARQVLAFIDEVVGEPAFLICNSVGGTPSLRSMAAHAAEATHALYMYRLKCVALCECTSTC